MATAKKEKPESSYGFKSYAEAASAAIEKCPVELESLQKISQMINYPLRTKEDFRWFVLFNILFSLARKIEPELDDYFSLEIQKRIHTTAEMFLQ